MTVFLDAGHGGRDPGAMGCGYSESQLVTTLTNQLADELRKTRMVVNTSRNTNDLTLSLKERCVMANSSGADLFISLHINSAESVATGTEVFYYDEVILAAKLSKAISSVLGLKDRGAKESKYFYVLNSTSMTAILIEFCFINNPADVKALLSNTKAVVEAIAQVIVEYYAL